MQTFSNPGDTHSRRESLFSSQNRVCLSTVDNRLYTSLNCNRIALKCLKIRGNQFSESLMMMAVAALLQWLDQQLVKPIQITETDSVRNVSVFDCIQYVTDKSSKSFSSQLLAGKSQTHLIPCSISLNQLLPDQWMEAVLVRAVAAVYLNEIRLNRLVYRCIQEETIRLVQRDARFQHLIENLLPCALALDEPLLSIAHQLLPHGNASFEDLTLIWRHQSEYQKMIDEVNPLLRLFHLTRLQRMKRQGARPGAKTSQLKDLTLVAVF